MTDLRPLVWPLKLCLSTLDNTVCVLCLHKLLIHKNVFTCRRGENPSLHCLVKTWPH